MTSVVPGAQPIPLLRSCWAVLRYAAAFLGLLAALVSLFGDAGVSTDPDGAKAMGALSELLASLFYLFVNHSVLMVILFFASAGFHFLVTHNHVEAHRREVEQRRVDAKAKLTLGHRSPPKVKRKGRRK